MSKITSLLFVAAFLFISSSLSAQWAFNGPYYFYSQGNVGVGTNTPSSLFHVNGTITAGNAGGGLHLIINDINTARWALGTGDYGFHLANDNNNTWTDRLFVSSEGNVGIGTNSPQGKLAVNGDIFSRVIKVTINGWPDYVFHPTYRLRPLSEVEQYIQQYRHLPEMPSAEEVDNNYLDLGNNQALLLKKIEELTLYIIEQDKQIKKLADENKELAELKKEVKALQAIILTK